MPLQADTLGTGVGELTLAAALEMETMMDEASATSAMSFADTSIAQMLFNDTEQQKAADGAMTRLAQKNAKQWATDMVADSVKAMSDYRDQIRGAI